MFWKILTALSLFASVACAQTATPTLTPTITPCVGCQGPLYPTSCTDIGGGTTPWTDLANFSTEDGNLATSALVTATNTSQVRCIGFGFSVPTDATITGVNGQVKFTGDQDPTSTGVMAAVHAGSNGVFLWSKPNPPTLSWVQFPNTLTEQWGFSWTPAQINASNTGFIFEGQTGGNNQTWSVDSVRMEVFFITATPTTSPSVGTVTTTPTATSTGTRTTTPTITRTPTTSPTPSPTQGDFCDTFLQFRDYGTGTWTVGTTRRRGVFLATTALGQSWPATIQTNWKRFEYEMSCSSSAGLFCPCVVPQEGVVTWVDDSTITTDCTHNGSPVSWTTTTGATANERIFTPSQEVNGLFPGQGCTVAFDLLLSSFEPSSGPTSDVDPFTVQSVACNHKVDVYCSGGNGQPGCGALAPDKCCAVNCENEESIFSVGLFISTPGMTFTPSPTPTPTNFPLTPVSCCQGIAGCSNVNCDNVGNVNIGYVCGGGGVCVPPTVPGGTPTPRTALLPNVFVSTGTNNAAFLVHITAGSPAYRFGFKFEYDASIISVNSVSLQPYSSNCTLAQTIFNGIPGSVTAYLQCYTALGGDGDLLYVSFDALSAGTASLIWDYFLLDDGAQGDPGQIDGSVVVTGPTETPTRTFTSSQTPTITRTPTATVTVAATPIEWDAIFIQLDTPTPTPSFTVTSTPADTPTVTQTLTSSPTLTPTPTNTPEQRVTMTETPQPTFVPTPDLEDISFFTEDTPTFTPRPSFTPTATKTPTFLTPVPTATPQICCDCGNDCIAADRGTCPPQCTPVPNAVCL